MKKIFFFCLVLALSSCSAQEEIPKAMHIAFEFLDKNYKDQLEKFKNIPENDSIIYTQYPYTFGKGIESMVFNSHNHPNRIDKTKSFFDSIGIKYNEVKLSIILKSYHKHLNKKDIELQAEIDFFKEYWKPVTDCYKEQEIKAKEIYNRFSVSDTINIKMPRSEFAHNNAVGLSCPYLQWNYDKEIDLSINGIIRNKVSGNDETDSHFIIEMISKNHPKMEILSNHKRVGDKLDIRFNYGWKIKTIGNNDYK